MKRYLLTLLLLVPCTACGTMSNLSQSIADAREVVGAVQDTVERVKPQIDEIVAISEEIAQLGDGLGGELADFGREFKELNEEARENADKDGDGELSWNEWLLYALGFGGGGVGLVQLQLRALRKRLLGEAEDKAKIAGAEVASRVVAPAAPAGVSAAVQPGSALGS